MGPRCKNKQTKTRLCMSNSNSIF